MADAQASSSAPKSCSWSLHNLHIPCLPERMEIPLIPLSFPERNQGDKPSASLEVQITGNGLIYPSIPRNVKHPSGFTALNAQEPNTPLTFPAGRARRMDGTVDAPAPRSRTARSPLRGSPAQQPRGRSRWDSAPAARRWERKRRSSILQESRDIFSTALTLLCPLAALPVLLLLPSSRLSLLFAPPQPCCPFPLPRAIRAWLAQLFLQNTCPQAFKGFEAVNLLGRLLMPIMALFKQ